MFEQVLLPHSVVAGRVPTPDELGVGCLAINLKDRVLYTKGYDGIVIRLDVMTGEAIIQALGYTPVKGKGTALPQPATDQASAIDLVNKIRTVLIDCGIAS
jgi:hypothetical protein